MAFKILTENSVDNTNIDGARAEHFNAGLRDGIVKGAFNEGIFSALASNVISFDTCELRISGHRVIIDEIWTQTFSSSPSVATRYALVGQVVVDSSSNVDFSLFVQNAATQLVKDNLFRTENGAGTYQVEIGRFTLTTLGTVTDIVRTLDTITGGSSGKGEHFVSGNMTTVMLESGMQANVIAEDQYNANGEYQQTNMTWELPETAGTVVKVNNVEQANIDFTSDPQTQLNNKVDKETGKGLSTNDYTTEEKTKLGGIEAEANKTIVDSALSTTSENPVQNKVVKNALLTLVPIGTILSYAGKVVPTGYLMCNGSTFDTSYYSELYSVLGTNKVPSLNRRFLEGTTTLNEVGSNVSAGLPNISGTFSAVSWDGGATGAFKLESTSNGNSGTGYQVSRSYSFSASKYNSIYGNSTTVQPNAYRVMYIIKAL